MTTNFTPRSRWLALAAGLGALATPAACSKTPNPEEVYGSSLSSGGSGSASTSGGSASGGSGNQPASGASGGESASGGSGAEAGSGAEGGGGPGFVECGPAPVADGAFSKKALRQAAAACADWHYCQFENAASALAHTTRVHAEAPSAESVAEAREAFRDAMAAWSTVELFQFGPLASKAESAGKDVYQGQGLRELVYAWPLLSRCRVEEQVAGQAFLNGMDGLLISARGLYALEYALFYPGTDTACAAATPTGQAWPGFDAGQLEQRKLTYALAVADDVVARVRTLRDTWSPEGQNFLETFVSASGYPTEQDAMNALGFALIYVERELKDWKLGIRAGYTMGDLVPEAPFASAVDLPELPTEAIRQNLRGFRALFQGCGDGGEGLGIDDWLTQAGHATLSSDILAAWQNAQDAADAFPPLELADAAELAELYQTVKVLTDLLKSELFGAGSPLGLKLPANVGSDTD